MEHLMLDIILFYETERMVIENKMRILLRK